MSLHPSLKIDSAGETQRSVFTRIERIKALIKKGEWVDGQNVTALPKTRVVKVKAQRVEKKEDSE